MTLLGAKRKRLLLLMFLGWASRAGTGSRRWVSKDGAAGRSREEPSSLRWGISRLPVRSYAD